MKSFTRVIGPQNLEVVERGRTRSALATRSAPPFLPSLKPSYRVELSRGAKEQIQRECRAMFLDFDSVVETGGWLLANASRLDRVVVATAPGDDARYSPTSLFLGHERMEAVRQSYPALTVVGDWHCHPGSDDGLPSETDRKGWAGYRGLEGLGYFVGIVVTRGTAGGWTDPRLSGWITTESCCERLTLEEL